MNRLNNFDFLRIVAAYMVLVSHQFALTGRPEPSVTANSSIGSLAVWIFFSISGYLISQSWQRDPHIGRFLLKRFLRIWPGLAVVALLSVFVVGPLVTTLARGAYFADPLTWNYLHTLRFSVKFYLPGVFEGNVMTAVNGSLWTIPIEVRCYIWLMVLGCLGALKLRYLVLAGTGAYAVYAFFISAKPPSWPDYFGLFFFAGVSLDLFRDKWQSKPEGLLLACTTLGLALFLLGQDYLAMVAFVPPVVICIGMRSTPVLRKFGRFGDVSYGVYIYAFLVQQLLVEVAGKDHPFYWGLAITLVVTTILAFLSWHFVEAPALRLKQRFGRRNAANAITPQHAMTGT